MDLGNECRILCDKEIDDYCRSENFGKILYIMGIGFDHRMNIGLSKFAEMNLNLEVWAIEHSRGGWSKDTKQIELEKKNVFPPGLPALRVAHRAPCLDHSFSAPWHDMAEDASPAIMKHFGEHFRINYLGDFLATLYDPDKCPMI